MHLGVFTEDNQPTFLGQNCPIFGLARRSTLFRARTQRSEGIPPDFFVQHFHQSLRSFFQAAVRKLAGTVDAKRRRKTDEPPSNEDLHHLREKSFNTCSNTLVRRIRWKALCSGGCSSKG
jgi:hypothetical protein